MRFPISTLGWLPWGRRYNTRSDSMMQDKRLFMDLDKPFKGVCGDCALTCFRLHGSNADGNRSPLHPPCFNKKVADYSVEGGPSCWLKVPEAFVAKYLPHVERMRMILENRDGKRWPVTYSAAHGFQKGWREFSTANELAVEETLFFSLVEESKLVVHVFDKSGCEKRLTNSNVPTSSDMPSSSEYQQGKAVHDVGRKTTHKTETPTPMPAFKSFFRFRPGGTEFNTPRYLRFNDDVGERGITPGGFYEKQYTSDDGDDDDAVTHQNQHKSKNSKDWIPSKLRSHSMPPVRRKRSWKSLSDIKAGSSLDTDRGGSTPSDKGQEGYPKLKTMATPTPRQTRSQIRFQSMLEKAKVSVTDFSDLNRNMSAYNIRDNQNPAKRRRDSGSQQCDREGFEESSGFNGRPLHGPSEGRSAINERIFKSSLDDAGRGCDNNEESAKYHRNRNGTFNGRTTTEFTPLSTDPAFAYATDTGAKVTSGRYGGGPPGHQKQDSPEIPEFASPRTPMRPPRDSSADITPKEMRGPLHDSGEMTKPKRGRPFKLKPDSTQSKQVRDVFVSQRRPVTQLERDEALTAAYSFSDHISSTTVTLVMRQSFVYRHFILGIPKRFGHRYMPPYNKDVKLVDADGKAWLCTWNAAYKYISGRGWRNFALEHCVEEDDVLLFHLLSETKTTLIIKVHIFRVVAIPHGLTGWQSHICPPNTVPEIHSGATMQPLPEEESLEHRHLQSNRVELPIHPRLQSSRDRQLSAKKIKREPATECSAMTESSQELD